MNYSLAGDGHVEMVIYNIAGQKVHTLISGQKEAGYYTAIWDASSYPSGMYFIQFIAGDFIKTRKLMLIK
jgi:flagellar hook assembly protein FlgD